MSDVMVSAEKVLDRLGREELQLKQLGLVNQAAGLRVAIVAIIKEVHEAKRGVASQASLEPSP